MDPSGLMSTEQIRAILVMLTFTLLSGLADSQGFVHASAMWSPGRVLWPEMGKSAAGFIVGFLAYWPATRYMSFFGVRASEVQTAVWFVVAIVGVAAVSGKLWGWPLGDKVAAVIALSGLLWLTVRTRM